jgi:hypothetical protein
MDQASESTEIRTAARPMQFGGIDRRESAYGVNLVTPTLSRKMSGKLKSDQPKEGPHVPPKRLQSHTPPD